MRVFSPDLYERQPHQWPITPSLHSMQNIHILLEEKVKAFLSVSATEIEEGNPRRKVLWHKSSPIRRKITFQLKNMRARISIKIQSLYNALWTFSFN